MKKFNSVDGYMVESTSYARTMVFVVENDVDRTQLPEGKTFTDLFPEVDINGEVYRTKSITGKSLAFPTPVNLGKGTRIGIAVVSCK